MCDILGKMEGDRAGKPPAAAIVPREMWADKLASFCQHCPYPQGGWEGETDREEGWKEGLSDR